MGFKRTGAAAVLLGAVFVSHSFVPTQSYASPRSSALIDEGIVELQRNEWRQALAKFLAASVADPDDSEALFFQGVAMNRLGLHEPALAQIEKARNAGVKNADMDFELGWAQLGTGQYDAAVDSLSAYRTENPDSGKASELIGRAELARGNNVAADAAFDTALRLDPSLESSINFFRAAQAQVRGNSLESADRVDAVAGYQQNSALSQAMRRHQELLRSVEATRPQQQTKPWRAFGVVAVGRNSNVIALSEDIARPADITRKDSTYYDLTAGGEYRMPLDPTQSLTGGVVLNHRNYRDIGDNDTHTINLYGRYDKQINNRFLASVTASYGHVRVAEEKRQTSVGISPSLQYRINDRLSLSAFYQAQKFNYPEVTNQAASRDRDSKQQSAGANLAFAFPSLNTEAVFGISRINNSSEGSDNDYNALRFSGSVRTQLPYDIVGAISFVSTDYDYENLNSLAPTSPPGATAFGFVRQDGIQTYSLELTRPINETYTAYARASKTNANSNLAVFSYDQKDIQIGVTARF
ncbi:MAG: tetratricopeptide repeat protein [Alphaproteobacteria bacterium]|nr:tetratricopeptide repeat protein [Alphaproteobacteria bacterium]